MSERKVAQFFYSQYTYYIYVVYIYLLDAFI